VVLKRLLILRSGTKPQDVLFTVVRKTVYVGLVPFDELEDGVQVVDGVIIKGLFQFFQDIEEAHFIRDHELPFTLKNLNFSLD
jgi:hypothetical protein